MKLEIKGFDKLIKLGNLFPSVAEKHINTAISRSLVRILGKEKQEAPVRTGNLRDNWSINMGRFKGILKSNAKYSSAVEYGTKFQRSNPFFKRSLNNAESGIEKEIAKAINDTIKQIIK